MADYEEMMAEARRFNARMDRIEIDHGFATPDETGHAMALRTAMVAVQAGIVTDDWTCVAQAQVMLEQLVGRLEARTGKSNATMEGLLLREPDVYLVPEDEGLDILGPFPNSDAAYEFYAEHLDWTDVDVRGLESPESWEQAQGKDDDNEEKT